VLCLSVRATTGAVAKEILEAWFNTRYLPNPADDEALQMLDEIDRET
jgi:ribose 5-phosphate isomerase B